MRFGAVGAFGPFGAASRAAFLSGLAALGGCAAGSRAVVPAAGETSPGLTREVPTAAGVEIEEETGRFEFEPDGSKVYTYVLKYRVLTDEARERWSRFEVRWAPEERARPEMSARVEGPDGVVHHLAPTTVVERVDDDGEARTLSAELPGVQVGSRVERTVVYRDRAPPALGEVSGRYALGLSVPVQRSRIVFDAPVELRLRYHPRGIRPRVSERVRDGRRVTELVVEDLPAVWTGEPLLAPDVPRVPHVVFSSAPSWSAWAAAWSQVVQPWRAHARSAGLASLVPTGTTDAKIFEIQRRVHEIVTWKPEPISRSPRELDVLLAGGEADALEKALLMSALFEAGGIEAQVALSKRGLGEDLLDDFADGEAIDHALVYLPGRDVFIDVTDRFVPPGELSVPDQGRRVLLLEGGGGRLAQTPASDARRNRYREARVLDLIQSPELTFFEQTTAEGAIEARLRDRFTTEGRDDVRRYLGEYLHSSYRGGRLEDLQLSGLSEVAQPFSIELAGRGGGLVQTEGARTTVFVSAPVLFTWLPKPLRDATLAREDGDPEQRFAAGLLATRTADLFVPEPYAATIRFDIRVPDTFRLESAPESRTMPLGPALYHQSVEPIDGGWRVDLGFVIDARTLTPDEARAMVGGLRELWGQPLPRLVFEDTAQRALDRGELARGLELLHRDAQRPGSAGPLRLASALLDAHLGQAAHRWARLAVERAPDDPATLAEASRILEHDELGERFAAGFPRADALRYMRRARKELRGAGETNARLARLLSINAAGLPNRDPAELEEAVVLLDDMVTRKPTEENVALYAELLHRTGRRSELVRRAAEWPRSLEVDALRVAAWVQLDGLSAALERLDELSLPSEVSAVVADRAARALVDEQAYASAAELLEAVIDRAEDAEPFRERADLYRRIAEGLERSIVGPAEPVFRLKALLADFEPGLDRMQPLFTDSAWSRMDPASALGDLARASEWAQRRAWEAGLPLRWPSHVTLSHTRFDWEGDDRVGFRVQTRIDGPGAGPSGTWFVVRDGQYRIQAVESSPGLLGAQALDWLERGRERAARRWLGWAADLNAGRGSVFGAIFEGSDRSSARLAWAAAALAPSDPRASAILEKALLRAPEPMKPALYEALVRAHAASGNLEAQVDAARAWVAHEPATRTGHRWVFSGLLAQGRLEDAEAWARARKPEVGFDALSARELAEVALNQGRYRDAEFHLRDVMDRGFGDLDIYNQLAWIRLLRGVSMPEDLDLMEKALARSPGAHPPAAHTLACHLVEQGKLRQGIELVLERKSRLQGLERDDWFVLGRVLERAGLHEDARAAYERVGRPARERDAQTDTWRLVERRLRAMGSDAPKSPTD